MITYIMNIILIICSLIVPIISLHLFSLKTPNLYKIKYIHIIMGCDYYIYNYLEIQHINGISYYEFPTIRGYYCELECGFYDSDDDEHDYYYNSTEYKTLYENMKKICLTPRKPVVIYNNNSFISPKLEMKYLPIIQNKIKKTYVEKYARHKDTGIFTSIEEIINVIKKEERYDPN